MIYPGRYTADIDEPFVVFLIGARVNSWRYFMKFRWVGQAFQQMTTVLAQYPEKGYLGGESFVQLPNLTSLLLSYWQSYEHLERFAHDKDDPHLEPWRRFNREIGNDGSIGVWHETYLVQPRNYESIYVNMPEFALAKATKHIPVTGRNHTARGRLQMEQAEDHIPVP